MSIALVIARDKLLEIDFDQQNWMLVIWNDSLFWYRSLRKLTTSEFYQEFLDKKQMYLENSALTDGISETGAYGVPSKSQNLTILGQGGSSST